MVSVFDLHCDTPYQMYRSRKMHISVTTLHKYYRGAIFAHFIVPGKRQPFVEVIKMLSTTITRLKDIPGIKIIRYYDDMDAKKCNILFGVEGGHIFDNDFAQVVALYDIGVRVFTLTWNNSNKLAHSAFDNDRMGLTKKGRDYLSLMKDYGLIIDVSHSSTRTVLDVCQRTGNEVIASHSCIRALNRNFMRNIDDRAVQAIAERKGIIGINVSRKHLGSGTVADHIDHLVKKYSEALPAIGTDFDGINDPVIAGPEELFAVEKQLKERGYRSDQIAKIFGGNFLNLLKRIDIR